MLLNLHVKNLALVEEAEIEFGKGFNILTGETGAGKSIVLGSINMALGQKTGTDVIGRYGESAFVELTFFVEDQETIRKLNEQDIYPEDGFLYISRRITPQRSIIKINGETIKSSGIKNITGLLMDVHGQHDHQSLLNRSKHLEILDKFANTEISELKSLVKKAFSEYKNACRRVDDFNLDEEEKNRTMAFLAYEAEEIDKASLTEGEDDILEKKYRKMQNSRKIVDSMEKVHELMGNDVNANASELTGKAFSFINSAAEYDGDISGLCEQLGTIDSLISDFNRELSEYMISMEFDEKEFDDIEKRLDRINGLKSKYGKTIADIFEYRDKIQKQLDDLYLYDENKKNALEAVVISKKNLLELCRELTKKRAKAAAILKKNIIKSLEDLNFEQILFEIDMKSLDEPTENGIDQAEFLISLNPGETIKPLSKIASGGEMSRIMLGIKAALAQKDDIDTLIFDEIDTGISGRAAQKVAEKMKEISSSHQIICITHLPQIASMSDTHFLIQKEVCEDRTRTVISRLSEEDIPKELARMLGGMEITEAVLENAIQMRNMAKEFHK